MLTYESTLRFSHPRDASHLLAINRFLKRGVRSGICFVARGIRKCSERQCKPSAEPSFCLSYAEAQPAFAAKQQRKYAPLFSPSRRLASARYKSFFEERGKKRHLLRCARSPSPYGDWGWKQKKRFVRTAFLILAIDYSAGAIASFGQTEAQVPQSVH